MLRPVTNDITFLACPDFKGIKTVQHGKGEKPLEFLACPDFKGIKTCGVDLVVQPDGFWPALISKGLRLAWLLPCASRFQFLACPDFKGIKTGHLGGGPGFSLFLACPDFKGIKTHHHVMDHDLLFRFWPALISKGLRL